MLENSAEMSSAGFPLIHHEFGNEPLYDKLSHRGCMVRLSVWGFWVGLEFRTEAKVQVGSNASGKVRPDVRTRRVMDGIAIRARSGGCLGPGFQGINRFPSFEDAVCVLNVHCSPSAA